MSDRTDRTEEQAPAPGKKPANTAPDAVMDPNEKTEGKPGLGPRGGASQDDETDPGSG
ncbi:hypothetical protein [Methylobacterium soli]|uniref:hypothetical protein n=1 Tax=Methylobacterium soli TaxID=553447 RepID=UPI001782ACFB|nr:hypothetical protein [Methylobacterium soli]GJE42550.1 hypothetical protein AEGHOMDF_1722 [Methylobacterium soli]